MSHDEHPQHGMERINGEPEGLPTGQQQHEAADSISPPNPSPGAEPTTTTSTSAGSPVFIVVMGVAGTGKTTLARALEARLRLPYIEGDALHPAANIAKMSAGTPLTDADREPWLELIRTTAEHMCAAQQHAPDSDSDSRTPAHGDPQPTPGVDEPREPREPRRAGVLATCSALRGCYRDILRGARAQTRLATYFVYIKGDRALLLDRISRREGHFMKATMLESQLRTLESPEGEDGVVVVPMEASTEEQTDIAVRELNRLLPEPLRDYGAGSAQGKDY